MVILIVFFLIFSSQAFAGGVQNKKEGFLTEARFFADIEKHFGRPPYQLVYSWESNIGLNALVYRKKIHEFRFEFDVQTAGSPSTGRRVNIAGTSYILGFIYTNKFNEKTNFSTGLTHLSSHLSEDVLKIVREETKKGNIIPAVGFDDINVVFMGTEYDFGFKSFGPKIKFRLQPVGVKFHGGISFYDEPIFVSAEFKVLSRESNDIIFINIHEFGKEQFNDYAIRFDFLKQRKKEEGRLQLSFGYSPGDRLKASPNVGWHKEGFSTKMKFVFWAY